MNENKTTRFIHPLPKGWGTGESLLTHVAQDILIRFGTDMSRVAVVFPNKRASLFLNNELARLHPDSPIWCPTYITISDLMRRHSDLQVADQLLLICRLYDVFVSITGFEAETLDQFYPWGQVLLADFDDLDKNMGDADKIFSLLSDIHDLDTSSYLTPQQEEILQQFFSTFSPDHNTKMREKFLRLWNKLGDIYTTYRQSLRDDKIAYEGMLYRDVAESHDIPFEYDTYCFIGFNMLQKVEQQLFTTLQRQDKALFYWDYDNYYLNDRNEAGHFIKGYLTRFPDALAHINHSNFIKSKGINANEDLKDRTAGKTYNYVGVESSITFLQSSTENLQARYVRDWLLENDRYKAGARTVIVMSDEHLLQTIIHSLPDELCKVNITTGYPLSQSPVVSLIHYLIDLQTAGRITGTNKFHLRSVSAVLQHPYTRYLSDNAVKILRHLSEQKNYFPSLTDLSDLSTVFTDLDTYQGSPNAQLLKYLQSIIRQIAISVTNEQLSANNDQSTANNETNNPVNNEANNPINNEQDISLPLPNNGRGSGRWVYGGEVLVSESLFRTYTILQRLLDLVETDVLTVDTVTMRRLIHQIISTTTIPFHGEPVEGVQIMGILETRCLDFDHILLLSCNEGNMPKGVNDSSFIPHSIRHAFGLTTVDNKVSIYSYYFHRLLQRASDVTIAYNTSTDGMNSGEMSRFMLQLMVESGLPINRISLKTGITTSSSHPQEIVKTPEIQAKLADILTHRITPSSLNKYLRCQLMYYYIYVLGLQEDDLEVSDDIDNITFGIIFHSAAEHIYNDMRDSSGMITKEKIKLYRKDESLVERAVDKAFATELFHVTPPPSSITHHPTPITQHPSPNTQTPTYRGLQIINRRVIIRLINDLLDYDLTNAPFLLVGNEIDIREDINIHFDFDNTDHKVTVGGIIDRLDIITNPVTQAPQVRVIDYKTGAKEPGKMSSIDDIFDPAKIKEHSDYYLQAFLYTSILQRGSYWVKPDYDKEGQIKKQIAVKPYIQDKPLSPALLFIQKAHRKDYTPTLSIADMPVNDISSFTDDYRQHLSLLLEEINNPAIPFTPTKNTAQCDICPFKQLCKLT